MQGVVYIPNYVAPNQISVLQNEVKWENVQAARGECFMADDTKEYQYISNGPVYTSIPFHPLVKDIMLNINEEFGYNLNVCFLNYYINELNEALAEHQGMRPDEIASRISHIILTL